MLTLLMDIVQTTIMAATYGEGATGGVVLGADTRTSSGNYIANRATDKITQLTNKVSFLPMHRNPENAAYICKLCVP